MAEEKPMPMLTEEELFAQRDALNGDIAKEAYVQAERRLLDCMETKKNLEQRGTTLLGGFITLSVAFCAASVAAYTSARFSPLAPHLLANAALFIAGAMSFVWMQLPSPYPIVGDYSKNWITSGLINAPDMKIGYLLSVRTLRLQPLIEAAQKSNKKKASYLDVGITCGLLSACLFVAIVSYRLFFSN